LSKQLLANFAKKKPNKYLNFAKRNLKKRGKLKVDRKEVLPMIQMSLGLLVLIVILAILIGMLAFSLLAAFMIKARWG
jgi:hypothetical protein